MADNLQQAITYIKAGDKPKALQLLGEILTVEPDNEQAWLWMSAVVSEDRRLYCIQKVLQINPNNQQALKAIAILAPDAKIPMATENLDFASAEKQKGGKVSNADMSDDHREVFPYYLIPDRDMLHVLVLQDGQLFSGISKLENKVSVERVLDQGDLPLSNLVGQEMVDYVNVTEVSQAEKVLRIQYNHDTGSKVIRFDCRNKAQAEEIFRNLHERLGNKLERQQQALSTNFQVGIVFLLFLFVGIITFFLYYQSLAVVSGDLLVDGDGLISGLVDTLYSLGPFGILLIGGGIMAALWIWMIVLYRRPPQMSKLVVK